MRDYEFKEALRELKVLPSEQMKELWWDLIPLVTKVNDELQLKHENSPKGDEFHELAKEIISTLHGVRMPKEALLVHQQNLRQLKTLRGFNLILDSVHECLQELEKPDPLVLIYTVGAISGALEALGAPQEVNYENAEERKLMDMDPSVLAIVDRFESFLNFLGKQSMLNAENISKFFDEGQRQDLRSHLVKPLQTTLGLLDLSPEEKKGIASSRQHRLAIRVAEWMSKLGDPVESLGLSDCFQPTSSSVEYKVHTLSGGVAAYIIFCLHRGFPRVYSPFYLGNTMTIFSLGFLGTTRQLYLLKGMDLLRESFYYVQCIGKEDDELKVTALRILKALFAVMTTSQSKELRTQAMEMWRTLYSKCQPDFQLDMLYILFKDSENPSVRGFILDTWRKHLTKDSGVKGSEIFRKLIHLPEAETTDMVDQSEYLMASLSMIRHLALNGMLEKSPEVESYLQNFKKGLQYSKAHYELRKTVGEDQKSEPLIQNLPRHMEKDVLDSLLTRLDMMDCVLGATQSDYDSL